MDKKKARRKALESMSSKYADGGIAKDRMA